MPALTGGADHKAYAQGHEHSHQTSEANDSKLSLNHGNRWEMDEHTRTMLIEMEKTFFLQIIQVRSD